MIQVISGSVVYADSEAIVNAANSSLMGGGGVDGAIHLAAGEKLNESLIGVGPLACGDAVITPGFNLKAKYIIHTVGPIYSEHSEEENEELLSSCYFSCLDLAKANSIHSISFPGISTGIYGYPLEEAVSIAVRSVKVWLNNNDYDIDIYFYCFTDTEYKVYKDKLPDISNDLLKDVEAYLNKPKRTNKRGVFSLLESNKIEPSGSIQGAYEFSVDAYEPINSSIEPFLELDESFQEVLFKLIDKKYTKDSDCYKKANIDRRLFSKIRSDVNYKPSKQTALALCIALELNIGQTEDLLKRAGYALSPSDIGDSIVKYFIKRKNYNINEIDSMLLKYDQKTLTNYN